MYQKFSSRRWKKDITRFQAQKWGTTTTTVRQGIIIHKKILSLLPAVFLICLFYFFECEISKLTWDFCTKIKHKNEKSEMRKKLKKRCLYATAVTAIVSVWYTHLNLNITYTHIMHFKSNHQPHACELHFHFHRENLQMNFFVKDKSWIHKRE